MKYVNKHIYRNPWMKYLQLEYMWYKFKYVHKQINQYDFLSKIYFCTQWHINSAKLLLWLCVLFYSSFVYTCVCVFLHIQSPLRECRSTWSGASGLPYYCAPLLCISVVIELLAVWRHNKPKTKNQKPITHSQDPCMQSHFTSTSSPPTPLHLIAISVLAINSLSRACRWASPQQPLRIKKKG